MSLKKQFLKATPSCKVTFRLSKSEVNDAEKVMLAGSFSNWEAEAIEMNKLKSGDFTATLTLPSGQQFEYRYLVDGTTWINDPEPDAFLPNGMGGENSVISTIA